MADWLCIDEDSPELEQYVAETVADAVGEIARMFDDEGVRSDDPGRQTSLAHVASTTEEHCRRVIAQARAGQRLH